MSYHRARILWQSHDHCENISPLGAATRLDQSLHTMKHGTLQFQYESDVLLLWWVRFPLNRDKAKFSGNDLSCSRGDGRLEARRRIISEVVSAARVKHMAHATA